MRTTHDVQSTRRYIFVLGCMILGMTVHDAAAQFQAKWMSVGSLHSWYSEIGCEVEEGRVRVQQDGLQWPAIYPYQDMEVAKALWIGVQNFTDEQGRTFPHKVVHAGPRGSGKNEFFPIQFEMISRFAPPQVEVNGEPSFDKPVQNNSVDPSLKADRVLVNVVNTQTGITMTRKIMQFGQEYHDNYIVYDYVLANTGNVDGDPEIELPNTTLEGVYFFFQYRYAICSQTRYVVGIATGWGVNTMLDTRGDGVKVDPPNENFRAQFAWHGKYPFFTLYDNLGAPIWFWDGTTFNSQADTTGRLGAPQFVGVVTLHADKSSMDKADDPAQPSTTGYKDSDHPLTVGNDPFDVPKMTQEYAWMQEGHASPRHADKVEPQGKFDEPTGDPALGTPGAFSAVTGYGPYNLKPGESIRIVMAEAAAGLSREMCTKIGQQYKRRHITAKVKNQWVLSGKDSLFQAFHRALANYNADYNIPQPPRPPKVFRVNGGNDRIVLSWELHDSTETNLKGFEIYRSHSRPDSTYKLIYQAGPNERRYEDKDLNRDLLYYYYIVAVGDGAANTGAGLTPGGPLRSNRYYTQIYHPARLSTAVEDKTQPATALPSAFVLHQNYPNPFNPMTVIRFDLPRAVHVRLEIFDLVGRRVRTLVDNEMTAGYKNVSWDAKNDLGIKAPSGIYIYRIKTSDFMASKKMILIQ